ncbi:MAG: hypothetical protein B7733_25015 [Myxococcales bacterium FL481]|nr:MAG: hypothetical protein B7733_25015 [Myxococcales bacterium FL481]
MPNRATDPVDPVAALQAHYARAYRPAHNPARLYLGTRAAAIVAGDSEGVRGRGAVLRAEVGHTWNWVGYAIGFTFVGGTFQRDVGNEQPRDRYPVLIGGGPSISLGRLSLLRRSFFDLRIAYDFLYGSVYRDNEAHSRTAPHGPRLDIDLGLLAMDAETRRRRHGLGATLGVQRLLGSFTDADLQTTMISIGLVYKFS